MKYLSLETVAKAYVENTQNTSNKFWGLLAIISSLNHEVRPCVSYTFEVQHVSNLLEKLFALKKDKKTYSQTTKWGVIFSNKWVEYVNKELLSNTPNIYDVIGWYFRNTPFEDDVNNDALIKFFLESSHLSVEVAKQVFDFKHKDLLFSDTLYSESQLASTLKAKFNIPATANTTITFDKNFVVASPGELARAPFVQPLYAGQGVQECLILTQFSFEDMYTTMKQTPNTDNQPLQQIYYGAPGTGKSHQIDGQTNDNNLIRTTFHPDTDYATFVGAYKPMMDVVDEYALDATGKTHKVDYPNGKSSINYKYEPQVFLKAYIEAWKRYLTKQEGEDDSYYLVIEEINRGNCAQIFGDLFQLLDREDSGYSSYAISPESSITKYLAEESQSADGTKFSDLEFSDVTKYRDGVEKIIATADDLKAGKRLVLPPNLHIWATMNTSDQSLFPIDSAFKRRWDWQYIPIKRADKEPENKWIIKVTHNDKTYWCYWWEFLETINHQIEETTHSEDKQLGYFFAKPKAGENFISIDTFVNKVIFYLWNDVFKDEDSAVFQYDNNKVEDVSISRSGTMYFRHFIENKDEMIHYFINQLFAMGKDNTPVVPIDYLKYDNDPTVIEHLPKMREDRDETPMPKIGNNKEEGDADGKNGRNTDKYIVDGTAEQIHKKQLLEKIVKKQIEQNPNITIEELKGCWDDISLNSQPCVLSEEEYQKLIKENPSYEGRYNQVNNGIWVNNQIGGEDTALKIIEKAKSLGVSVEIVKK